MKAILTNYRQSPRKVRLVADQIRGKKISEALAILSFTDKKSSNEISKVLMSAVANAINNNGADRENLFIKEIKIDKGLVIKRFRPRARGSAFPIRHRTSHINIILGDGQVKPSLPPEEKEKPEVKTEKKEKKVVAEKKVKKSIKKPASKK